MLKTVTHAAARAPVAQAPFRIEAFEDFERLRAAIPITADLTEELPPDDELAITAACAPPQADTAWPQAVPASITQTRYAHRLCRN